MKLRTLFLSCFIALLTWVGTATAAPEVSQTHFQRDLNQILSDRRFSYPDHFRWLKQILNSLLEAVNSTKLPHYQFKAPGVDLVFKQLGLGLVILLPLLLVFFSRKYLAREKQIKANAATNPSSILNASENLNQAKTSASQGEYRLAIRYLYLASLTTLRSIGTIPEGNRFSDKENLHTLRRNIGRESLEYQSFDQLVALFREKWYGLKTCTATDYQNATRFYDVLAAYSRSRK